MTAAISDVEQESLVAPAAPRAKPYLTAVPECEPPFDGTPEAAARAVNSSTVTRPMAAVTLVDSGPLWPPDAVEVAPPQHDRGVTETARMLARGLIEALSGFRQPRQLATVCSAEVCAALPALLRRSATPPKLISVRATEPSVGIAEVTAVFRRDARVAAVAFRMQGAPGRWQVTALETA